MAETYTSNLGLTKPDYDSPADISVINSNMDKIDNAVANAGKVKSVNEKTGDVTLTAADVGALPSGGTAVNATHLNGKSAEYYATAESVDQLSEHKADKAGWTANKIIGTDANGNLVAQDPPEDNGGDADTLGGKDPKYYLQPRNLLDNSDFRNPVNQRGQESYTGEGNRNVYTIDRWMFSWQAGATLTVGDGFIQKSSYPFVQHISGLDVNKTYTVALAFLNGDVHVYSGTIANSFGDWNNSAFVAEMSDGLSYIRIGEGVVDPIIWAALYEGTYTADNLPPYVPKGYAAELAECQRYYVQYDLYESFSPGKTFSSNAKLADIQFNVPCNFRASNLSIADYPDTCQVIVGTNGYMGSLVEGSVRARGNIVTMEFQSETDMPLNALCALRMIGKFALSADL